MKENELEEMDFNSVLKLLNKIERIHQCRISLITRRDVEDEFRDVVLNEADGSSEQLDTKMTDEQWEIFQHSWFWRKGYSEIMWDGVMEAVRWDLREEGIVPNSVVVE